MAFIWFSLMVKHGAYAFIIIDLSVWVKCLCKWSILQVGCFLIIEFWKRCGNTKQIVKKDFLKWFWCKKGAFMIAWGQDQWAESASLWLWGVPCYIFLRWGKSLKGFPYVKEELQNPGGMAVVKLRLFLVFSKTSTVRPLWIPWGIWNLHFWGIYQWAASCKEI